MDKFFNKFWCPEALESSKYHAWTVYCYSTEQRRTSIHSHFILQLIGTKITSHPRHTFPTEAQQAHTHNHLLHSHTDMCKSDNGIHTLIKQHQIFSLAFTYTKQCRVFSLAFSYTEQCQVFSLQLLVDHNALVGSQF